MRNFNIESLLALKEVIDSGAKAQKVCVEVTKSHVVEDYNERRKKFEDIKDYIESRIQGVRVEISGGYNKPDAEEPDGMRYDPIIVTTYKNDDERSYSRMKMDGFYMNEPNTASLVYDTYLDFIVSGNEHVEHGTISFWESTIDKILEETYLCECGFTSSGNQLTLWKDEVAYIIIEDIAKEVEGAFTIMLPEDDEDLSLVIVCKDKNVLLSNDCFYIDAPESEVA